MRKRSILIVDDNRDYCDSMSRFFSSRYDVHTVSSINDAKNIILGGGRLPNVVITDIRLDPDNKENRDGLRLLEFLRVQQPNIPVVVVSGHGRSQAVYSHRLRRMMDAVGLGAFSVISKSSDPDILATTVGKALLIGEARWKRKLRAMALDWSMPTVVFIAILAIWESLTRALKVPEYLMPPPSRIAKVIVDDFSMLALDTGITMLEAALGFLVANIAAMIVAVGFSHYRWFERSFYPYAIALKSVPVIAMAPLLVLWFGYGLLGKVVMAAIISFFPLVVNATQGLKSVDTEALDLMRSLSASRSQILFKLRFPNALPYIFSALKISSALSVVGAIVGELTGANKGIGFVILMSSYNVDTPMLFAAIIAASFAGICFFGLVSLAESATAKKYGFSRLNKQGVT